MKFTLVEAEIKQAITDYIGKVITVNPGATIEVDLKATRGADGVTAEVDVALAVSGAAVAPAPAAPVKREPAPAAPVKPAPVAPAVTEPVPEQLATATAPVEPEIPDEPQALEVEVQQGEEAPVVPGKSIFG